MLAERGSRNRIRPDDARAHISVGGERMVAALLGPDCRDPKDEIADFRARYASLPTPDDCLFAGVRQGLDRLVKAGFTLSICSNKPQALCEKVLAELGIAHLFMVVVGGGSGRTPKPAPDLLQRVLDLGCFSKDECIFIGDGEPDLLAARASGVPFLFASYGYCEAPAAFRDVPACGDFGSLADLLTGWEDNARAKSGTLGKVAA
jgi:phosphoglycolate phosphatase